MTKPKSHKQYEVETPPFDAYPKEAAIQGALGSDRTRSVKEVAVIQSTNYIPGISGWRLTTKGLEFGATTGAFPAGSIQFADIQNIATARLLGRSTAASGSIEQITIGTGLSLAAGALSTTITQYTDEMAEDAVGGILTDTNSIDFTYNDGANTISADIKKQNSATINLSIDASGLKADTVPTIIPQIIQGATGPTGAPGNIGHVYVDTVAGKVYISAGTAGTGDWKILN